MTLILARKPVAVVLRIEALANEWISGYVQSTETLHCLHKYFRPYFTVGTYFSARWKRQLEHPPSAITKNAIEEEQWPLSRMLVSRSLQTRSFSSDKVRRNSNDEVVWRWLKESIAGYPQNWVRLKILEGESYGVVLYPMSVLAPQEIVYYNRQLKAKGLPILDPAKRYLPINVFQGDIICPNWAGLIDVEEPKLVFLEGSSG